MRIAQIAPLAESVPPKLYGGTERVVYNLTRGLLDAGHEVTVFCSGDSSVADIAHVEAVWPEALRLSRRKIIDPFAYQVRTLEYVLRLSGEFDVLHNHYEYGLLPLTRMTETPVLTTTHLRLDDSDARAALEMYPDAPLVSISNSQRTPLANLNWMSTIYHGIDPATFKFHPAPGKYLAFLGRFSPEKRPEWAIEIARRCGIPLKIAAKIEERDREYYEQVVKPRIDGKFIEYVGEIGEHEKSEFLGNAVALIFPIDWPEPFGLVMAEAMACGTPVLTRPHGSVPEIVSEGLTGFIRTNIHELGDLVESAARLDRMAIRREFERRFSIQRMTEEYLNVYTRLCADTITPGFSDQSPKYRRMASHRWNILHSIDGALDGHPQSLAQG